MVKSFNTHQVSYRRTLFALVSVAAFASATPQAEGASQEAKVKTAYLYTFLRSVTWPASAFADDKAPYGVTIVGADKLEGLIDKVAAAKSVNKRKIVLERIDSIDSYKTCHILYMVGELDEAARKAILEKTNGNPVLVVGETANFAAEGAAVNFYVDEKGAMGFQVNQGAAEAGGMKLDAKILKVGDAVK